MTKNYFFSFFGVLFGKSTDFHGKTLILEDSLKQIPCCIKRLNKEFLKRYRQFCLEKKFSMMNRFWLRKISFTNFRRPQCKRFHHPWNYFGNNQGQSVQSSMDMQLAENSAKMFLFLRVFQTIIYRFKRMVTRRLCRNLIKSIFNQY